MHDMFNTYTIFKNNQHFLMLHAHIPALPNLRKLCTPLVSKVKLKGGPTRPRTPLLGFAISKTTRDIFMRQLARERP